MKILIKNGTVVTSVHESISDVLTDGGRIINIGSNISEKEADRVIDASGLYILPGGVDPHVHMHLPGPAGYSSDDFYSGSKAALFGGTTTILDFVTPAKGESLTEALNKRKEEAEKSLIDYSFHVSPVDWHSTSEEEINECIRNGITSFKVYMAYKSTIGLNDSDFSRVLQAVGRAGGLVTVHCELGDEVEELRERYASEGRNEPLSHPLTRPSHLEAGAVAKAIKLAGDAGCSLYIVHVSAGESLQYIREAQRKGQRVIAETCPQYLLLDDSRYTGDFKKTSPFVISPPLRKKEDNDALWKAIKDGTISTVGTDHCPFSLAQKMTGQGDFRKIPNGAGGIEHRLALLYTYGVCEGRTDMKRLVDVFSIQPAKIFGLYPRKGDISIGSDADLVIWDPEPTETISVKTHHQNCDTNIYEGIKVQGNARYVISQGIITIEAGKLTGQNNRGRFVERKIPGC